jgi:hypothetical protein
VAKIPARPKSFRRANDLPSDGKRAIAGMLHVPGDLPDWQGYPGITSSFCETFGEQANPAAKSFSGIELQTLPFPKKTPVTFRRTVTPT